MASYDVANSPKNVAQSALKRHLFKLRAFIYVKDIYLRVILLYFSLYCWFAF